MISSLMLLTSAAIDYTKPVHLVRTPGPSYEITEIFAMNAPNI